MRNKLNTQFLSVNTAFLLTIFMGCQGLDPPIQSNMVNEGLKKVTHKNFAVESERQEAIKALEDILSSPQSEKARVLEGLLISPHDEDGLFHKIKKGPIDQRTSDIINKIIEGFSREEASRKWLEQKDKNQDALSSLLLRVPVAGDDEEAIIELCNEIAKVKPTTDLVVANILQSASLVDWTDKDNRKDILRTLKRISAMSPGITREQISRGLVGKPNIGPKGSGLFQALAYGPVDDAVLAIYQVLISDQTDREAKSSLVNEKLGTSSVSALNLLADFDGAKKALGASGVRLTALGDSAEVPHRNQLLALLVINGGGGDVWPKNFESLEQRVRYHQILESLLNSQNFEAFPALFGPTVSQDEYYAFVNWAVSDKAYAPALKAVMSNSRFSKSALSLSRAAFEMALDRDLKATIKVKKPKGLLGVGVYKDDVALKNLELIIDNLDAFGLRPGLDALNFSYGDFGPLILMLVTTLVLDKQIPKNNAKAAIKTIAAKLKPLFSKEKWQEMVLAKGQVSEKNAVDEVMKELKMSKSQAENLLGL